MSQSDRMNLLILRLESARNVIGVVYSEMREGCVGDEDMDHLASLTCEIDEAIAEVRAAFERGLI